MKTITSEVKTRFNPSTGKKRWGGGTRNKVKLGSQQVNAQQMSEINTVAKNKNIKNQKDDKDNSIENNK
jgi:hypothetical protein